MSGDGEWFPADVMMPDTAREVAGLYQNPAGELSVRQTKYLRPGWMGGAPLAWREVVLPAPPPCWPPPGSRLAELRRELAEAKKKRAEAIRMYDATYADCQRIEAEIAQIEGSG